MIVYPNAKINIGLNVLEKRADGFHNIETIFYPIETHDILEIDENHESDQSVFIVSGIEIDSNNADNLVIKALNILKEQHKIPPLKIALHKQIPLGAGLGGGSADAAFTLSVLNDMFGLVLSEKELIDMAAKIGSDCAFFIPNVPKFAFGKGNFLEETDLNLAGFYLMLIKPEIHIATKEAYSLIQPGKHTRSLALDILLPIEDWRETIKNDFEIPIFKKYPEIKAVKEKMYELGAIYSSMSGSGSSVYGIFRTEPQIPAEYDKMFRTVIKL